MLASVFMEFCKHMFQWKKVWVFIDKDTRNEFRIDK